MDPAQRTFSKNWVFVSMAAFIAGEILIAGVIGEWLLARVVSINANFLLQGLVNLAGFVLGGFAVGLISPGRRIAEPAVGGFATMLLIGILALFVPFRWMGYGSGGLLLAGAFAAALGGAGAYLGEKLTGNLGPGGKIGQLG